MYRVSLRKYYLDGSGSIIIVSGINPFARFLLSVVDKDIRFLLLLLMPELLIE